MLSADDPRRIAPCPGTEARLDIRAATTSMSIDVFLPLAWPVE